MQMKKLITITFILMFAIAAKAQYGSINAIIQRLEEKKGVNQDLSDVNIDNKKFVLVKDFDDHTERSYVVIKGNKATYVELFDDKQTGQTSSNVFSGDVVRSNKNIISLRCDVLEGQKIPVAITKTFLLTRQKKIIYLVDITNKDRWIDEISFSK